MVDRLPWTAPDPHTSTVWSWYSWLTNDHDLLNASLHRYVGHPAYDTDQLKADLGRFTFLLGGDTDGELFQPPSVP